MSEGFGMLSGLEKLNLSYCPIQSLPDSESPHSESFYFHFMMSEGFGHLSSLQDLNLGFCKKLDINVTVDLLIKLPVLTKLGLFCLEMAALPDSKSHHSEHHSESFYFLIFDVRRFRAVGLPCGPQHGVL